MNSHKSNYGCFALLLILALLIAGRILYVRMNRETYQAQHPISKVERSFEWLTVEYAPSEPISKVVNLDVFNGLNPSMSKDEFDEMLGEPFERRIEDKTVMLSEYRTPMGEIEIADGFYQYEEGSEEVKYIKLKPNNVSVEQVLGEELIRIIRSNGAISKISIHKPEKRSEVLIYLKGDKIDFIMWDEI